MPLWHNIGELMDYYIPPMPSLYWIDITRTCNLQCVMCPQSRGLSRREAKMPMALFRRIVDEVCENRPMLKLYLSGEPLLHERLFDMIDYAADSGCETMLHTNATVLTENMTKRLLAASLAFLSFSFDGCTAEIYEKLRPPANQPSAMFCASWVWGPAAGPTGVARRRPASSSVRSRSGSTR